MKALGVDVSKQTLVCAFEGDLAEFANTPDGFQRMLAWSQGASAWCMEATGRFHVGVAHFAQMHGIRCLVVNPARAKKYLGFVSGRAKTDRVDALALARLGEQEGHALRAYRPVPEPVALARDILVRRKALIGARVSLTQVALETGDPGGQLERVLDQMDASVQQLEKELGQALRGFEGFDFLRTIPGVGPLSAALLVCALERGEFLTPDSLVAFAGLDPRPRDSGKHRGKRALSHQGDAQLRTVLFMAARAGARTTAWKPYYERQLAKGLSSTEATVILARKLLRVAWKVYRQKAPFVPRENP